MKIIGRAVLILGLAAVTGCNISRMGQVTDNREIRLDLHPLATEAPDSKLPLAPWVDGWNCGWDSAPPTFTITDPAGPTTAQGWVAVSDQAILLKMLVREATHENHQTDGMIFDGDSIQVAVDARGDGSGALPPDTHMVNIDDGIIAFALTDTGPQAWAHHLGKIQGSGAGNPNGAMPQLAPKITRDDANKETLYQITLPWAEFHTAPGYAPVFGLAVQLNVGCGKNRKELHWGQGAAGGIPTPGRMNKLRIGPPPRPTVTLTPVKDTIWNKADAAEVEVSVLSPRAYGLRAQCRDKELGTTCSDSAEQVIPAADDSSLRRYLARLTLSQFQYNLTPLHVWVADQKTVIADLSMPIQLPQGDFDALIRRLAELRARADHPLVLRSLQNLQDVAEDSWNRGIKELEKNDSLARETLDWINSLRPLLHDDLADWELYAQGSYQLVIAFPSPSDGSLQLYKVRLPNGYSPDQTYPLYVELHGGGDQQPLQHIQLDLPSDQKRIATGDVQAVQNSYFEVKPFAGRDGFHNRGERHGETHTWQQIQHMEKTFRTDPDRRYLGGGSMGGSGTWEMGTRVPDHWAGLNIMSFGMPAWEGDKGFGRNVSYLPVYIAAGEEDPYFPMAQVRALGEEVAKWGNQPTVTIFEKYGHAVPNTYGPEVVAKLLHHSRTRPDHFQFITEDDQFRSCWGITLFRQADQPTASLDCRIAGSVITLTTEHAAGVEINAGADGLNLSGPVRVIWNGREAYAGPSGVIRLGKER